MMTIKFDLSVSGIENAIQQLTEYSNSLEEKTRNFVEMLEDVGITAADLVLSIGTHTMPERIRFEKEIEANGAYTIGAVVGIGETFPSVWVDAAGTEHVDEVFPLHMMEFGSAIYALPPQDAFGGHGGQGTFSVMGNETKASWYVTRIDSGEERKVKATAIVPTRPMYNAMIQMREQILDCAKRAFG